MQKDERPNEFDDYIVFLFGLLTKKYKQIEQLSLLFISILLRLVQPSFQMLIAKLIGQNKCTDSNMILVLCFSTHGGNDLKHV